MDSMDLMLAVADFNKAQGVKAANQWPDCWEAVVGKTGWWLAVNAHGEPKRCTHGPEVPAYHVYVEWNGWPAGMFSAFGGEIAAGSLANVDTLVVALRAEAV
jgi:hypothetical protein